MSSILTQAAPRRPARTQRPALVALALVVVLVVPSFSLLSAPAQLVGPGSGQSNVLFNNVRASPQTPTSSQQVTVLASAWCVQSSYLLETSCQFSGHYRVDGGSTVTVNPWFSRTDESNYDLAMTLGPFARGANVEAWFSETVTRATSPKVTVTPVNSPPQVDAIFTLAPGTRPPTRLPSLVYDFALGMNDFGADPPAGYVRWNEAMGTLSIDRLPYSAGNGWNMDSVEKALPFALQNNMDWRIELHHERPEDSTHLRVSTIPLRLEGPEGAVEVSYRGWNLDFHGIGSGCWISNTWDAKGGMIVLSYNATTLQLTGTLTDMLGQPRGSCTGGFAGGTRFAFDTLRIGSWSDEVYNQHNRLPQRLDIHRIQIDATMRHYPPLGSTISLTATSTDRDNDPVSYTWVLPDGSTATGRDVVYPADVIGPHVAFLEGRDTYGGSTRRMVSWYVPNVMPTVSLSGTAFGDPYVGDLLTFAATGSTDPDGPDPLSVIWSFGDGATAVGTSVAHAYPAPGRYLVGVTVSDGYHTLQEGRLVVVRSHADTLLLGSEGDRFPFGTGPNGLITRHDRSQVVTSWVPGAVTYADTPFTGRSEMALAGTRTTYTQAGSFTASASFRVDEMAPGGVFYPLLMADREVFRPDQHNTLRVRLDRPSVDEYPRAAVYLRTQSGKDLGAWLDHRFEPGVTYTLTSTWNASDQSLTTRVFDSWMHEITSSRIVFWPGERFSFNVIGFSSGSTSTGATVARVHEYSVVPAPIPAGQRGHVYRMEAVASSGDATYSWSLGDGTRLAGPLVTHAFAVPGALPVNVTISRPGVADALLADVLHLSNAAPSAHVDLAERVGGFDATFSDGYDGFVSRSNGPGYHLAPDPAAGAMKLEGVGLSPLLGSPRLVRTLDTPVPGTSPWQLEARFRAVHVGQANVKLLDFGDRYSSRMYFATLQSTGFRFYANGDVCSAPVSLGQEYVLSLAYQARTVTCTLKAADGSVVANGTRTSSSYESTTINDIVSAIGPMGPQPKPSIVYLDDVRFAHGPSLLQPGQAVTLDATRTRDAEGDALNFTWTLPGGSIVYGATATYTPGTPGVHQAHLRVSDGWTATERQIPLLVGPLPAASLVLDPAPGQEGWMAGQQVAFDVQLDPPVANAEVRWSFGDGTLAEGGSAVHVYEQSGRMYVTATVTIGPHTIFLGQHADVASSQPQVARLPAARDPTLEYVANVRPVLPGAYQGTFADVDRDGTHETALRDDGDFPIVRDERALEACLRAQVQGQSVENCGNAPVLTPSLQELAQAPVDAVRVVRYGPGGGEAGHRLDGRLLLESVPATQENLESALRAAIEGHASVFVVTDPAALRETLPEGLLEVAALAGPLVVVPQPDPQDVLDGLVGTLALSPHVVRVNAADRDGVPAWAKNRVASIQGGPTMAAPYTVPTVESATETAGAFAAALAMKGIRDPMTMRAMMMALTMPVRPQDEAPNPLDVGAGILDPLCLGFNVKGSPLRVTADIEGRISTGCAVEGVPTLQAAAAAAGKADASPLDVLDLSGIGSGDVQLATNLIVTLPYLPGAINVDFGIVNHELDKSALVRILGMGLGLNLTLGTYLDPVTSFLGEGIEIGDVLVDLRVAPEVVFNTTLYYGSGSAWPLTLPASVSSLLQSQMLSDVAPVLAPEELLRYLSLVPTPPEGGYHFVDEVRMRPSAPPLLDLKVGPVCANLDPVLAEAASMGTLAAFYGTQLALKDPARAVALEVSASRLLALSQSLPPESCAEALQRARDVKDEVAALRSALDAAGVASDAVATADGFLDATLETLERLMTLGIGRLNVTLLDTTTGLSTNSSRTADAPLGFYFGATRIVSKGVCITLPSTLEDLACRDISVNLPAALELVGTVENGLFFRDGAPVTGTTVDGYGLVGRGQWITHTNFERRVTQDNGYAAMKFVTPGSWYFRGFYDYGLEFLSEEDKQAGLGGVTSVPLVRNIEGGIQNVVYGGGSGEGKPGSPSTCSTVRLPDLSTSAVLLPVDPALTCIPIGFAPEINASAVLECVRDPALEPLLAEVPGIETRLMEWATSPASAVSHALGVVLDLPPSLLGCLAGTLGENADPGASTRLLRFNFTIPGSSTAIAIDRVNFNEAHAYNYSSAWTDDLLGTGWGWTVKDATPQTADRGAGGALAGRTFEASRSFLFADSANPVPVNPARPFVVDYTFPIPETGYLRMNLAFEAAFNNSDAWLIVSEGGSEHDRTLSTVLEWIRNKPYQVKDTGATGGVRVTALSATADFDCLYYDPNVLGVCEQMRIRAMNEQGKRNYTFSTEWSTTTLHPQNARLTFVVAPLPDLYFNRSTQEWDDAAKLARWSNFSIHNLRVRTLGFDTAPYGLPDDTGAGKIPAMPAAWRTTWEWEPRDLSRLESFDVYVAIPRVNESAFRLTRSLGGVNQTVEVPSETDQLYDHCRGGGTYAQRVSGTTGPRCSAIRGHLPDVTGDHGRLVTAGGLHQDTEFVWFGLDEVNPRYSSGDDVGLTASCGNAPQEKTSVLTQKVRWGGAKGIRPETDLYTLIPGEPITGRYYDDFAPEVVKQFHVDYYALRNVGLRCVNERGGLGPIMVPAEVSGMMRMMGMGAMDTSSIAATELNPRSVGFGGNQISPACFPDLNQAVYDLTRFNLPTEVELPCLFITTYVNRDPGPSRGPVRGDAHLLWHVGLPILSVMDDDGRVTQKGMMGTVFDERAPPVGDAPHCPAWEGRHEILPPVRLHGYVECAYPVVHKVRTYDSGRRDGGSDLELILDGRAPLG